MKCPHCKTEVKKNMNKIQIGDTVAIQLSYIKKQLLHFNENYLVPVERELREKDYPDLHFYLEAYLNKFTPQAEVISYGAEDGAKFGRLNLKIQFKHMGKVIYEILNEDDVKKVKDVSSKERKIHKRKTGVLRSSFKPTPALHGSKR